MIPNDNNRNNQSELSAMKNYFKGKVEQKVEKVFNDFYEESLKSSYRDIITLDECLEWGDNLKTNDSRIKALLISVKPNPNVKGTKDRLILTLAVLDGAHAPITEQSGDAKSIILYTDNIDLKLVNLLNGKETQIISWR